MAETFAPPTKTHPGERLATYFDNFFKTIVGVATLGASVTFSKVLSQPVTPWIDYGFSTDTVQDFLAISWLLFLLDLVITSFAASALSLYHPQAVKYFGTSDSSDRRIVMWWATLVSFVLYGLLISAFTFLGLAVTAYVGRVGWVAIAFTAFFGASGVGVIIWQSPIGSKSIGDTKSSDGSQTYSSEEKMNFIEGASLSGDDYAYKKGTPEKGRYTATELSRVSWAMEPTIPPYTADLRRLRSIRGGQQQDRRDWADYDARPYNSNTIS